MITDIAKQMQPKFQAFIKDVDDTDWMFRTPSTFVPLHKSTETVQAADIPALSIYHSGWSDDVSNLSNSNTHPLAAVDSLRESEEPDYLIRDAEIELEMSFVDRQVGQSYGFGLANGQLARDVSLLGV